MLKKYAPTLILVLFSALLAYLWLRSHDAYIRETATAQARRDSLALVNHTLDSMFVIEAIKNDSILQQDSIIEAERVKVHQQSTRIAQTLDSAQNNTNRLVARAKILADSSVRVVLDSLKIQIDSERIINTSLLSSAQQAESLALRQLMDARVIISAQASQIKALNTLKSGYVKEIDRLSKNKGHGLNVILPAIAAGVIVGRIL